MAVTMASLMAIKPRLKAFSVSVKVSAREFLKTLIDGDGDIGGDIRSGNSDHIKTDWSGPPGSCLFHGFIEIVPVKEELGFIDGFIPAVINAPQNKIPVPRINGSFQRYGIA